MSKINKSKQSFNCILINSNRLYLLLSRSSNIRYISILWNVNRLSKMLGENRCKLVYSVINSFCILWSDISISGNLLLVCKNLLLT